MFCAGFCGIHRKASRMCAAIQYRPSLRNRPDRTAVIFLIEKESGLLSVFDIDFIENSIFINFRDRGIRNRKADICPAFILGQAFLQTQFPFVAFIDADDRFSAF